MTQDELFKIVLKDDREAMDLMYNLATVSQIWDDLIDQDKPVSSVEISQAFIILLSDVPRNAFYQANRLELQPLIESAIIDWLTANQFEADFRHAAWLLRDNLATVLIGAGKIIGGMAHGIEISPLVRRFVHDESYEDYCHGLDERTQS